MTMRVVGLVSFIFGLLGLLLLDGQVFTHAVMGLSAAVSQSVAGSHQREKID